MPKRKKKQKCVFLAFAGFQGIKPPNMADVKIPLNKEKQRGMKVSHCGQYSLVLKDSTLYVLISK